MPWTWLTPVVGAVRSVFGLGDSATQEDVETFLGANPDAMQLALNMANAGTSRTKQTSSPPSVDNTPSVVVKSSVKKNSAPKKAAHVPQAATSNSASTDEGSINADALKAQLLELQLENLKLTTKNQKMADAEKARKAKLALRKPKRLYLTSSPSSGAWVRGCDMNLDRLSGSPTAEVPTALRGSFSIGDSDTFSVTATPNPNLTNKQVRIRLKATADDWWKALIEHRGGSFVKELLSCQDKRREDYVTLSMATINKSGFGMTLSKAKGFGTHTNIHRLQGSLYTTYEYVIDWVKC